MPVRNDARSTVTCPLPTPLVGFEAGGPREGLARADDLVERGVHREAHLRRLGRVELEATGADRARPAASRVQATLKDWAAVRMGYLVSTRALVPVRRSWRVCRLPKKTPSEPKNERAASALAATPSAWARSIEPR